MLPDPIVYPGADNDKARTACDSLHWWAHQDNSDKLPPWEPLNNSLHALRGLRRAAARRASQEMAVVLFKKRNAADVRLRPRPSGPSGEPALCVALPRQATSLPSKARLDGELA